LTGAGIAYDGCTSGLLGNDKDGRQEAVRRYQRRRPPLFSCPPVYPQMPHPYTRFARNGAENDLAAPSLSSPTLAVPIPSRPCRVGARRACHRPSGPPCQDRPSPSFPRRAAPIRSLPVPSLPFPAQPSAATRGPRTERSAPSGESVLCRSFPRQSGPVPSIPFRALPRRASPINATPCPSGPIPVWCPAAEPTTAGLLADPVRARPHLAVPGPACPIRACPGRAEPRLVVAPGRGITRRPGSVPCPCWPSRSMPGRAFPFLSAPIPSLAGPA
jgi:hypothetical protein